jgi:hypothetical protein
MTLLRWIWQINAVLQPQENEHGKGRLSNEA